VRVKKKEKIKDAAQPTRLSTGEDGPFFGVTIGSLICAKEPFAGEKDGEKDRFRSSGEDASETVRHSDFKDLSRLNKVSLQRRTAGYGGKTATVVLLPRDAAVDLEALAKDMRKALGCGSRVEEGRVVLQGDIADRAEAWLLKRGVKRVTRGDR